MASGSEKKNFEVYFFPSENKLNSPNVHLFTEEKRGLWGKRLGDAREKNISVELDLKKLSSSKDKRGIIVFDCHNVFDSDIQKFTRQSSLWNEKGYEVHVCSFVGKGTETHAGLLAQFDDPCLQKVLKSLFVVFDRKHPKKGKGIVIQHLMVENKNVPIYFADDEVANLTNVNKVVSKSEDSDFIHYIHYVAVNKRSKDSTPDYAKRIDNFDDLVLMI
jgi:hypothetical protein